MFVYYLLWCTSDKKGGLKRSKLFAVVEIDQYRFLIDCEPYVIFVVVDPDLLPLTRVEISRTFHRNAPRLTINGELERQLVFFRTYEHEQKVNTFTRVYSTIFRLPLTRRTLK